MKKILFAIAIIGLITACNNNSKEENNHGHPHSIHEEHSHDDEGNHKGHRDGEHHEQEEFEVSKDTTSSHHKHPFQH